MSVILNDCVGMLRLDRLDELPEEVRTTDAGHILETDLISASLDELVGQRRVILDRMNR